MQTRLLPCGFGAGSVGPAITGVVGRLELVTELEKQPAANCKHHRLSNVLHIVPLMQADVQSQMKYLLSQNNEMKFPNRLDC